jgi:hypothetical protein
MSTDWIKIQLNKELQTIKEQKDFESNAPEWLKQALQRWREEQNNLE